MADAETTRLLVDEPSHVDRLNYERFLIGLDQLVLDGSSVQTPLTIAVYGSWGSGKSSLLRMLRKRLSPDDKHLWTENERQERPKDWDRSKQLAQRFVAAEFSPWSHRKETNLLVPLLLSLKEQLKPNAKMSEEIVKIAAITGWHIGRTVFWPLAKKAASAAVNAATAGLVNVEKEIDAVLDAEQIEKSAKQVEGDFERNRPKLELSDHAKVRELVEKFVTKVRKQGRQQRTLVLLIDDLDRCHPPEQIIELLEQIKLFLSIEGCIFVLACDREVVVRAIEVKFPEQGAAYLDKFVQLPIYLPAARSDDVARLIDGGAMSAMHDEHWHGFLIHVAAALGNNPRRFKRFENSFRLCETVLKDQSPVSTPTLSMPSPWYNRRLLAKWIVIRDTCPRIAERPQLLIDLEAGGQLLDPKVSDKVREYLGIDPTVWQFLKLYETLRFESIMTLSIYSRLTGQTVDINRSDIERRALSNRPMPTNLPGLDLSHSILRGADFRNCNLSATNFSHADLTGATFDNALVSSCDFSFAVIGETSWQGVQKLNQAIDRTDNATNIRLIANLTLRSAALTQVFEDFPSEKDFKPTYVPATDAVPMANAFDTVDLNWFSDVVASFSRGGGLDVQYTYWKNVFNLVALRQKQAKQQAAIPS